MLYADFITYFPTPPQASELPEIMPSPFAYSPHPIAERAALLLQQRLSSRQLSDQLANVGKMFGVLVVANTQGEIGFLSAFSGMMNGLWHVPGFVPPIFNQAQQDAFLPAGKTEASVSKERLHQLETSVKQSGLAENIALLQQQRDSELARLRLEHKTAKAQRHQQRQTLQAQQNNVTDNEFQMKMRALALASQHQKRNMLNLKAHWAEKIHRLQQPLDHALQEIEQLKAIRTEKSRQLHQQVFSTYQLHNALGEQQNISQFFSDKLLPPAGTGDCAGPKLVHFAHQHQLKPIAMAEFWWGKSPAAGVRHHGQFYPACRGKCHPILPFMLRGLSVEAEPDFKQHVAADEPQVIYEDDCLLVINKPAGLMSIPGKHVKDSVYSRLRQRYPEHPDLKLVHRLDMATSGLLLVAKNLRSNKFLQRQFIQRSIEKRYEAILSKALSADQQSGDIDLPLRVDFDDRPRQLVCYEDGKAANTHWEMISVVGNTSRVYFYPHTGRTHQLRVHASHRDGLNAAIIGDALYGQDGERLMLHAQRLCFTHPVSRERLEFEAPTPF